MNGDIVQEENHQQFDKYLNFGAVWGRIAVIVFKEEVANDAE